MSQQDNKVSSAEQGRKKLRKLSHALSWLLRHGAVDAGVPMSTDGYVPVDEVLNCRHPKFGNNSKWTLEDVRIVVETNDKKRFKLEERSKSEFYKKSSTTDDTDDDETKSKILCIRANQGHSLSGIDPNRLLTKISPKELVAMPMIVHGTYHDAWHDHIQSEGLKCMGRHHIHFATGLPNDEGQVISGMRRSCQVHIYMDAAKCARNDDIVFYKSDNGVVLSSGIDGVFPAEYFSHVTTASGSILLDHRSQSTTTATTKSSSSNCSDEKDKSP